jgi:hypothetical protein
VPAGGTAAGAVFKNHSVGICQLIRTRCCVFTAKRASCRLFNAWRDVRKAKGTPSAPNLNIEETKPTCAARRGFASRCHGHMCVFILDELAHQPSPFCFACATNVNHGNCIPRVILVRGNFSYCDALLCAMRPNDPASRFRAEFRRRETRFLALKARRAAILTHLPRWLHWLWPPPSRLRFW